MSRLEEVIESYDYVGTQIKDDDITTEKGSDILKNQAIINIDVTLAKMYDLMEARYGKKES